MKKTTKEMFPVTELTPELAYDIYNQIDQKRHDEQVSKKYALKYLKQLKAQIGKLKTGYEDDNESWSVGYSYGITRCMDAIDKKIAKINGN